MASWAAALCLFGIGNCIVTGIFPTQERELRPPKTGIKVGSLYYVREAPTNDISKPANLIKLCTTRLERYGITPDMNKVADIDLLDRITANAALDGIKAQFAQLGLGGSFDDYYSYSLRNVTQTEISKGEADRILNERGAEDDCADWRAAIRKEKWGVYQISSISVGDLQFSRKTENALSAEASAKIAKFEPKLKAELKRTSGLSFSGKGLVVSFQPILRN